MKTVKQLQLSHELRAEHVFASSREMIGIAAHEGHHAAHVCF